MVDRREADSHNKSRIKGWSVSDYLTFGSPDKAVILQARFDYIGYYTAQFSIDIPPGGGSEVGEIKALADITWTVEGNPITRRVSIINGLTISGMGESVNIKMYDFSTIADPPSTQTYKVSCSVAPGSRPTSGSNPVLVINSDQSVPEDDRRGRTPAVTVLPGTTAAFDIPENVGVNSLFLAIGPNGMLANAYQAFNELVIGGLAGATLEMPLFADLFNKWIPLPPAVTQVSIVVDVTYPIAQGIIVTPIYGIEG